MAFEPVESSGRRVIMKGSSARHRPLSRRDGANTQLQYSYTQFTPSARPDRTVSSASRRVGRCEVDSGSERVQTSDDFLSGDSLESSREFRSHSRLDATRRRRDSFVGSGLAV